MQNNTARTVSRMTSVLVVRQVVLAAASSGL